MPTIKQGGIIHGFGSGLALCGVVGLAYLAVSYAVDWVEQDCVHVNNVELTQIWASKLFPNETVHIVCPAVNQSWLGFVTCTMHVNHQQLITIECPVGPKCSDDDACVILR